MDFLKQKPRAHIENMIIEGKLEELLIAAGQIHGHFCPGLALGVMAAAHAMLQTGLTSDGLEDLIAIVETNNCFSDGVQFVTGCTFGNNALVFRDIGKMAFSLVRRGNEGIRISDLPGSKEYTRASHPWFSKKFERTVKNRDHSPEAIESFKREGFEASFGLLKLDFNRIFRVEKVSPVLPEYAPSHDSIICASCGEKTMATRTVETGSGIMCLPCSGSAYYQLDGSGISQKKGK